MTDATVAGDPENPDVRVIEQIKTCLADNCQGIPDAYWGKPKKLAKHA